MWATVTGVVSLIMSLGVLWDSNSPGTQFAHRLALLHSVLDPEVTDMLGRPRVSEFPILGLGVFQAE